MTYLISGVGLERVEVI